jgi:tRNA modification GTPase
MTHLPKIETIAALATPPGRGGVGIIRVSGPLANQIATAVLGHCPKPRYAEYLAFRDQHAHVLDQGIALFFPNPHSFTGEDVLELQGHGGPVVMDLLLKTVLAHGARLARPGEFSERAFLNDKLDLTQAEAIADLIDAGSEQAARTALRSLQGAFSQAVHVLVAEVTRLRVYVEASMDFPEEEIDFLSEGRVTEQVVGLQAQLEGILAQAQQGSLIREGINVVLAGQPNAGKSSLLNALSRREAAIVTDIPGTTRDVIREEIMLDGLPLHILDTAGLRESGDVVEQEGMRRTWQAIEQADLLLLLVDDSQGFGTVEQEILQQVLGKLHIVVLYNKCDRSGRNAGVIATEPYPVIAISAKQGLGLSELSATIQRLVGMQQVGEGSFMARRRHLSALARAQAHLQQAADQALARQGELLAEELKQVQTHLGEITGEVSSDDLLGEIFSSFCIGK